MIGVFTWTIYWNWIGEIHLGVGCEVGLKKDQDLR